MANPPNNAAPMGGMMAPSFYQQMADTGNDMLRQQGMQPYQPLQSPYFSNDFMQNHPQVGGALGGILGTLGNMGPTPMVSGFGEGLSRLAQGVAGNALMQRQWQQQQAMMPMQIASQVAQYRNEMAPQAISTPAGIALYNRQTQTLTPGLGMAQIAAGNNGSFDTGNADYAKNLLARLPDADEREQAQIKASAQSFSQIWDPQKRAEAEGTMFKDIMDKRLSDQHFQQTYDATQQQRITMDAIQRDNADSKRMVAVALGGRLALQQFESAQKLYGPAKDADVRLRTMQDAALHPNPQNDVALLYNHIAMTLSASGATPSQAEIFHAIETRSLPQAAIANLQKVGIGMDFVANVLGQDPKNLPPGGFLSPDQRAQMLNLGKDVRNYAWDNARRAATYQKVQQWEPTAMPGLDPVPFTMSASPSERVESGGRGMNNPNPLVPPGAGPNDPYAGFQRK